SECATLISALWCCYATPLSRHKRVLPDVTKTVSFDPLAPCSGSDRSDRMALPSESWQAVITEQETTLSELEDIEEALKDGKETLAALLRYLEDRAIQLSFRRLAATDQVVDLVRSDEERDARVVNSTVLRRLNGQFGLKGLLCKLQRLRAPEHRIHRGSSSGVTWRTFTRLGRTRTQRYARDYLVLRRLHRLLNYTERLFAEIIARRQHESLL
ncbi:hypothetical protein LSAT2_029320, partial [Lamellibrachia satsuma]